MMSRRKAHYGLPPSGEASIGSTSSGTERRVELRRAQVLDRLPGQVCGAPVARAYSEEVTDECGRVADARPDAAFSSTSLSRLAQDKDSAGMGEQCQPPGGAATSV